MSDKPRGRIVYTNIRELRKLAANRAGEMYNSPDSALLKGAGKVERYTLVYTPEEEKS